MAVNAKELSIYHRVWVYSKEEADKLKSLAKGITATKIKLGTVITEGGVCKQYTSILTSRENITTPDAIVVREGDIRSVKFTEPVSM